MRSTVLRYHRSPAVVWVLVAFGAFVVGVGSTVAVGFAVDGYWGFLVPWFVAVVLLGYYALVFVSIEARLWPDEGRLQFRAVLRSKETCLSDVTSMGFAVRGFNERLVIIRYRGGIARVVNCRELADLAQRVRESNPAAEVGSLRSRLAGVTGT